MADTGEKRNDTYCEYGCGCDCVHAGCDGLAYNLGNGRHGDAFGKTAMSISTQTYRLIAFDNSDGNFTGNPRVLGRGTSTEVLRNLKMLRVKGLAGRRYVMYKDAEN